MFSQNFNDKIITWTGDTIKCQITLINDYDIFYDVIVKNKNKNESIPTSKVRNYFLDKESSPDISLTKKKSAITTPAKHDSLVLAKKTVNYKNGFAINIEALIAEDFKLSYTRRIDEGLYFESMISYNIPVWNFDAGRFNNQFSFFELKDPFGLYGRVQIRIGAKMYWSDKFYFGPSVLYSYGSFNKKDGIIYSSGKNYYEVTRHKNDFEFLLKWGWTFHPNDILNDFYMGIGIREKYLNDIVYGGKLDSDYNYIPIVPPQNKKTSYTVLTLHLGYQIGYCK